jgi:bifunctional DNA-binding transcriptional regulator/antitoxin component of YhaV-PrlF toxin-antitoxin module
MKEEFIRGFDSNRRIAIPRKILEYLKINYESDEMIITIEGNKIILELKGVIYDNRERINNKGNQTSNKRIGG